MSQGAVDFLTKPVDDAELLEAVKRGLELDGSLRHELAERARVEASLTALTSREREVLTQVVAGRLNKQIASAIGASERTVKAHRARVMSKMGASSVAELVRAIDRLGLALPFPEAQPATT
jgi:FixJ family two-component response regulator